MYSANEGAAAAAAGLTAALAAGEDGRAAVLGAKALLPLAHLLQHPSPALSEAAAAAVTCLATASDRKTAPDPSALASDAAIAEIVAGGLLPLLTACLSHPAPGVAEEAAGALTNISASQAAREDPYFSTAGVEALTSALGRRDPELLTRVCAALANVTVAPNAKASLKAAGAPAGETGVVRCSESACWLLDCHIRGVAWASPGVASHYDACFHSLLVLPLHPSARPLNDKHADWLPSPGGIIPLRKLAETHANPQVRRHAQLALSNCDPQQAAGRRSPSKQVSLAESQLSAPPTASPAARAASKAPPKKPATTKDWLRHACLCLF